MFLALGLVAACGAYTQSAALRSDAFETGLPPRNASVKTLGRPEFAAFEGRPLAEALAHLRPDWLRVNPGVRVSGERERAVVYVNDVASGDLTKLQLIASEQVSEARLLSASEAWVRYGPSCRCPAGAIVVRTRSND
jgi:hypothetical protein